MFAYIIWHAHASACVSALKLLFELHLIYGHNIREKLPSAPLVLVAVLVLVMVMVLAMVPGYAYAVATVATRKPMV